MRNTIIAVIVAIGFFSWRVECAQASSPPRSGEAPQEHGLERPVYSGEPLTLQHAIDAALQGNPDLIALRKQFESARHRPDQERFLKAPAFEAQIWQWPVNTVNPLNTNMYMFMVDQDVPGSGKRQLRAAAAEKAVALTENEVVRRARQIVNEVKRTYADLFVARKAIQIHLDSVELLRQFADTSQVKYTAGRNSQQDVLKAIVEISKLHDGVIALEQQEQLAAAGLNALFGRAPDTPIGPLFDPGGRVLRPSVGELERLALTGQPELAGAQLEIERVQADLAVARRDYKPDFSVQGGYMLTPHQTDGWMGRIAITWPNAPWARGTLDARIAELESSLEAAKARRQAVENGVRLAVQNAYIKVKTAERRASLLRTTILPQSEHALDVTRVAYEADRADLLGPIDSERMLLDISLDYFRALSDWVQAAAELERAVGTDLTPEMTVPVTIQEVK